MGSVVLGFLDKIYKINFNLINLHLLEINKLLI